MKHPPSPPEGLDARIVHRSTRSGQNMLITLVAVPFAVFMALGLALLARQIGILIDALGGR